MKLIRAVLGAIILFLDRLFSPKPMARSLDQQALVDARTKNLVLYQLKGCPFCVKVRRQIKCLGLKIELRGIEDTKSARELLEGGKKDQVPCLKITENGSCRWMYESSEINEYLGRNFS